MTPCVVRPPPAAIASWLPPPPGWSPRPERPRTAGRKAEPDRASDAERAASPDRVAGTYLATAFAFSPLIAHRMFEFVAVSLPTGKLQETSIHALPPLAMLAASVLLWRRIGPLPGGRTARPHTHRVAVAAGLLLGCVAAVANLLSMLARAEGGAHGTVDPAAAALVMHVSLLAPIAEECAFRGLIYRQLRQSMTVPSATMVSALVFAMMHASLGQASWALALGIVTALAYEQTRSLLAPILVHALFNAVPVGMAMARSRPDDVGPIWLVLSGVALVFVWAARGAARADAGA